MIWALWLAACVTNPLDESPQNVLLHPERTGPKVTLTVVKGSAWTQQLREGPLRFNLLPQIAVWMETPDGRLIDTIYVTGALGQPWTHATKEKKGAEFYKECFPAWSARVLAAGRRLPEPERPYTDGVTSATPQSTFLVTTVLPLASMESDFVLRAEVNRSGDYNAAFPAPPEGGFDPLRPDPSIDWDGQPSVVYAATTRIVEKRQSVLLKPVGFGDPGADQQINPDLSKLDTALRIVSEIELTAH